MRWKRLRREPRITGLFRMRVWIAAGATDMRRGMHSLALQVQEALTATRTLVIFTFFAGAAAR
jgi:hypothetical protein